MVLEEMASKKSLCCLPGVASGLPEADSSGADPPASMEATLGCRLLVVHCQPTNQSTTNQPTTNDRQATIDNQLSTTKKSPTGDRNPTTDNQ